MAALDPAVRRRIEHELLNPADPPRSRAAIARAHDVHPRTVARIRESLGIPGDATPWRTEAVRAATVAATDRRRARRSELADTLLDEVQALIEQARAGRRGEWQRTVLVGHGVGETSPEQVAEDDATVARGVKDLHAAAATALGRTLDVDKYDHQPDDQPADDVLARLFDGLAGVYRAVRPDEPATDDTVDDGQPAHTDDEGAL